MGANHAWVAPDQLIGDWLSAQAHLPQYLEARARVAGAAHRVASLGVLCSRITQGPNPQYTSNDYPCVITRNVASDQLQMSGSNWVSAEEFSRLQRFKLQRGDILVTLKGAGSTGKACVFDADVEAIHSREVGVVRVSDSTLNPRFLCAYFQGRFGRLLFDQGTTGSTGQLTLSTTYLKSFPVPVPDRRIQDYIGAKVELAERCRAVSSRSWLAATERLGAALGAPLTPETFEVKSARNVSGSGYEVTSIRPVVALVSPVRLVGAIGAQFFTPRRAKAIVVIEQSGLGAERLSALADRFTKRVSADEVQARGLSYVGLAQVDSSTGYVSTATDEQPSSSSAGFGARDILFSKLRPYLNKVAICPEHLEEAAGSTELVTYRARPGVDPYYVFFVLKSPLVLNQVIDITSGSTHPRVDPNLIDDVLVPLAEAPVQTRIGQLARAALALMRRATLLVEDAKADVEALIEGSLDAQAILSGTLKAPTADDIPELAEDDA